MKVHDIMKKVVVAGDQINGKQAAQIMSSKGIGSLVIFKKNKILGIITERDIMRNISKLNKKVSRIMAKNVLTIESGEDIDSAADLMAEHKIKRLPVIEKGKLVGIITATDVIANSDFLNEDFFFD